MAYKYNLADPIMYPLLKEFAHKNKKNPTEAERYLWEYLRAENIGARFKRQHIIDKYIVDFVCLDSNLVIEVDGGYHSEPEQMRYDENRTIRLNHLGFKVLRYQNDDIQSDIDSIIEEIQANL